MVVSTLQKTLFAIALLSGILIFWYLVRFNSFASGTWKSERNLNSKKRPSNDGDRSREMASVVNVIVVFTNAFAKNRFQRAITSLVRTSRLPLVVHVLADNASRPIANEIIAQSNIGIGNVVLQFYDMGIVSKNILRLDPNLLGYFRVSPDHYYGQELFFLSLVAADLFPHLKRVIKIDADFLFQADIGELWAYFDKFTSNQLFGFAREQQPVYRDLFKEYRSQENQTKIGDPPPDGITGFNGGLILLELDKIRSHQSFRELIGLENVRHLVEKYKFKGHLGDQDLYTLLSIENPELFFVLPCQWNRQLCQWWRVHGYGDVFDQYFRCADPIKIYHGNCGTNFPDHVD